MKKTKKKTIAIFISITLLIFLCFLLTNKFMENDIFYTIKIGESIEKFGIDFKDHFSWISGLSYTYPHWLFDYFIYQIYQIGNFEGIYYFAVIMFSITIVLIFILNLTKKKKVTTSLITAMITMILLSYFSSSRAQIVTYIVFLLEIYFIDTYLKAKNKYSLIGLFILPIIIANTHIAVFYFYFILFIPYIVEYIIAVVIEKKKISIPFSNNIIIKKEENVKSLMMFLPMIFLMGFISPLGIHVYTYYPKVSHGISTNFIAEHDPITIKMFSEFFLLLLFHFLSIAIFKTKTKFRDILLLLGLTLMTLLHNRNYSLFLVLSNFIFCDLLEQILMKWKNKKYLIIITVIVILISSYYSIENFKSNKNTQFVSSYLYPTKAVNYIKENLLTPQVKLFNEYDQGSYLILNNIPVFFDSRAELYTKEFNPQLGDFFMKNMQIEIYYEQLFEEYQITHILVHKYSILNIIIENSKNYNQIYTDETYLIYERLN